MIRGVTYSNGKVKYFELSQFNKNNFSWLHCSQVSLKEINELHLKTAIPLFEIKHMLDPREKARIANGKDYSLVIFRALSSEADLNTYPVEFVISKNFLITITPEKNPALETLFNDVDGILLKSVIKNGFSFIVLKILLRLIRDYETFLERAEEQIDELEDVSLQGNDDDLKKLFVIKRKLTYLRRFLIGNEDMIGEMGESKLTYLKLTDFYRELNVEYLQLSATEELLKDRLTGVTYEFLAASSNNLNSIIKSFTVIASVLLLPALISSVYGMNLILPLGKHPYGFLIISAIMAFSMIVTLLFFKLKKWV